MLRLTKDSFIDFDGYVRDLDYLGFIYASKEDMISVCNDLNHKVNTLKTICVDIMTSRSGYVYNKLDRKSIGNYLLHAENAPESVVYKRSKATGNVDISLDSKKVLDPLYDRGYAREFIYHYKKLSSLKSILGSLSKIVDRMVSSDKIDSEGRPLHKITFREINEAPNRRVYYTDTSLQQIPKIANSALKAPKGYVLVSGDFKQSDVRIAYSLMLKDPSNIKLMTSSDDIYEVFARMFLGDDFDKEFFLENRKDFKVNTLAPIYGATGGLTSFASNFISKANKYLETAPRYQEFVKRINKQIDLNIKLNPKSGIYNPIYVNSYFGFEQPVQIDYEYGKTEILKSKLRDKVLNTPIQTGTSEIVIATERAIMDSFAKEGITPENGGIYAYMNRHDELLFLLKEDYLDKSYIFQEHEDVIVDDWIPLKTEFSFSIEYDKGNESLNEYAHSFYRDPEPLPKDYLNSSTNYMPIEETKEIYIGNKYSEQLGCYFVSFLDLDKELISFESYNTNSIDDVVNGILTTLSRNSQNFIDEDITKIIVYNAFGLSSSTVLNNLLVVFMPDGSATDLARASLFALYCCNETMETNGLVPESNSTLDNSIGYIRRILSNGELLKN